jgi:hypothetical protein
MDTCWPQQDPHPHPIRHHRQAPDNHPQN